MIRFREGMVEKRGGWSALLMGAVAGAIRALWAYQNQFLSKYVAVGGVNCLAVVTSGLAQDIAPRTITTGARANFSTVQGSSTVTVYDPDYTPTTNDYVILQVPTAVGGLCLVGLYQVTAVLGGSDYQINAGVPAASTITGGGVIPVFATTLGSAAVQVTINNYNPVVGSAFGIGRTTAVGGLNLLGTYAIASVQSANVFTITAQTTATATATAPYGTGAFVLVYSCCTPKGVNTAAGPLQTSDWSLAAYGNLLMAMPVGGGLYVWSAASPFRYALLVGAAPSGRGIMVSDAQQMVIVYGCQTPGTYLPNAVAWCDAGNYASWLATGTNQAGSFTLPTGSGIVGGAVGPQQNLLWTDIDVWSMSYIGYPFVWSFNKIATGCGLIAQFACVRLGSAVLWMSQKQFWIYDGGAVRPLPCTVWDDVFPKISAANAWKIRGGANSGFDEAMWFFPSAAGAGENDTYVCYNLVEGTWDTGLIARSAWLDQSLVGQPIGGDPSGNLYQHEVSPDAAGTALVTTFTTGWFLVEDGEDFSFVDMIRPDIKFPLGVGTVQVSVLTCAYVGDTPTIAGPYSITAATEFINTRARGRYVALQFASSDIGSFWRIGRPQMRFTAAGRN